MLVYSKHEVDRLLLCLHNNFLASRVKFNAFRALLNRSKDEYSHKHNDNDVGFLEEADPPYVTVTNCRDCRCYEVKRSYVKSLL